MSIIPDRFKPALTGKYSSCLSLSGMLVDKPASGEFLAHHFSWLQHFAAAMLMIMLLSCGGGGSSSGGSLLTVSGTIFAADNSAVDADVNDPLAPKGSSNNSLGAPQPVRTPATLGGYVNAQNDSDDYFQIDLDAGQSVILYVGDPTSPGGTLDLQLSLYDSPQAPPVDSGIPGFAVQCVVANQAGSYIARVQAFSGGSNYILTIGSVSCNNILRAGAEFVSSEVIVRFTSTAGTQPDLVPMAAIQQYGLIIAGRQSARGALRMKIPQPELTLQALGIPSPFAGEVMSARLQRKVVTLEVVRMLRQRPDVVYAEPNYIYQPTAVPNDTFYLRQWHYPLINLPQAWDAAAGGLAGSAVVAVIDTGVIANHPDLQSAWLRDGTGSIVGYDFVGQDADPSDPGDGTPGRSSFHGTHVAGIVAAQTDNTTGIAGVGRFPGIKIMPLRVLGPFGGTSTDLCDALLFSAGLPNTSQTVPPQKADIINLSIGSRNFSQTVQNCIDQVRATGVIIVAAAGNESSTAPVYPAAYTGVVSVSAVDINKDLAPYSSFGTTIDIAAPGGNLTTDIDGDGFPDGVFSTLADDSSGIIRSTYGYYAGTSMAAPHVAGVAALMKVVRPNLTADEFDGFLQSGMLADDLGLPGADDKFGNGLINAYKAVTVAASGVLPPAFLTVNPRGLNLGVFQNSARLTVANGGQGQLTVDPPVISPPADQWLTVSGSGLGIYTVNVDRKMLQQPGTYTASITFTALEDPNAVTVPVVLQIPRSGVDQNANAGFHYAVLINPDDLSTQQTVATTFANGAYHYQFNGVPAGDYKIWAGTDSDNDDNICDAGEACGAYATIDQPLAVTVSDTSISGLDFSTGFNSNLGLAAAAATDRQPITISRPIQKGLAYGQ